MLSLIIYIIPLLVSSECEREELDYPRYAWSFYDRKMPEIIQRIFDYSYNKIKDKWNYIFLTYDNLSLYLNTSSFPSHFKQMLPAHQSDYIRLLLIAEYGGWWIDTAIIVNNESILEELYEEGKEKNVDFVGVCHKQCPRKLIESSFFYAPKGSIFLKEWMKEFIKAEEMGEANYLYKIYREGVNIPRTSFKPYPLMDSYLVVFGAQQKALDRNVKRNISLLIYPAKKSIFKYMIDCKYDLKCLNETLNNKEKVKEYVIIKINSFLRRLLFPEGNTVTAYDSFYEPHPLKEGLDGFNEIIKKWIKYYFIYFCFLCYLVLTIENKINFFFFDACKSKKKNYSA